MGYCFSNPDTSGTRIFTTKTKIFTNNGTILSNSINTIQHEEEMGQNSFPNVKSIKTNTFSGYVLVYNNLDRNLNLNNISSDFKYGFINIYESTNFTYPVVEKYNFTYDIYNGTEAVIENGYLGVEFDNLNNDIIVSYYTKITYQDESIQKNSFTEIYIFK